MYYITVINKKTKKKFSLEFHSEFIYKKRLTRMQHSDKLIVVSYGKVY